MHQHSIRDTVLLSGWLFADLLLGLMMIFLATLPGAQKVPPVVPPTLVVSPTSLTTSSPNCKGGVTNPQCTVTVSESPASFGSMTWSASNDMSDSVVYSASTHTLTPGQSVTVTIAALPCQNGTLVFNGSRGAAPVAVTWKCTAPIVRLNLHAIKFNITVDPTGLLNNSQSAINSVKSQVRGQKFLQGRSVGLAIVYDGAPTDNDISTAQAVANEVYNILGQLGQEGFAFQKASYYAPLFNLNGSQSSVEIDVFLFTQVPAS